MSALPKRRRRSFRIWEWLCVLTANNGCCVYCGKESVAMDHVIPFARGGADELTNLVPICTPCNRSKTDKTPVEWVIREFLQGRWQGDGTPLGGGRLGHDELSLHGLYMKAHEEALAVLETVNEVVAEIADRRRQMWFLWVSPFELPGIIGIDFYRAFYRERIEAAKAADWPDQSPEHLRS
ncbi:HNH endonuclease [Streptomyces sp. NPDC058682]|uniref:HNH endonuclease n=1 Tax=Streptomyces sp. NPDC058682 TaxID=3346596 RepID=UPI003658C2D4